MSARRVLSHRIALSLLVTPLILAVCLCLPRLLTSQTKSAAKGKHKAAAVGAPPIGPVPLPNPHIPGYAYPVPEATMLKHVNNGDQVWITRHAWGLWTALTSTAGPGSKSHVYETWLSPVPGGVMSPQSLAAATGLAAPTQPFHLLQRPGQFHGRRFVAAVAGVPPITSDQVVVTVNWSPEMVSDVERNHYLSSTALNKLLSNGTKTIVLNHRSVSLKPTYLWLDPSLLVQGRYFQMSTWPGPPNPAIPFPSNLWKQCVWVDAKQPGSGTGTGAADTTCATDGSSRTAQSTYGVGSFIHFQLTAQEAKEWQKEGNTNAHTGDEVILVGMHVGSREMTEWAWQTFWWQPDASNPPAPSSAAIAAARPLQLKGAPRHYAQCTAYQMVNPNQPFSGGNGTKPLLCYNPYLEAPFSQTDLPASTPWTYQGNTYTNNVGVQTNCMSCHIQAAYPQDSSAPQYTGDQYIDLNSAEFNKHLQMDFSWSIVQNVK
jgi:hypothetical protein